MIWVLYHYLIKSINQSIINTYEFITQSYPTTVWLVVATPPTHPQHHEDSGQCWGIPGRLSWSRSRHWYRCPTKSRLDTGCTMWHRRCKSGTSCNYRTTERLPIRQKHKCRGNLDWFRCRRRRFPAPSWSFLSFDLRILKRSFSCNQPTFLAKRTNIDTTTVLFRHTS